MASDDSATTEEMLVQGSVELDSLDWGGGGG